MLKKAIKYAFFFIPQSLWRQIRVCLAWLLFSLQEAHSISPGFESWQLFHVYLFPEN